MGVDVEWVELILRCLSSASYSVNINGSHGQLFKPSRGLRQGDPLSPFMFLIYSKGLSALIRLAVKKGLFKGVRASRHGSQITHVLFVEIEFFLERLLIEELVF